MSKKIEMAFLMSLAASAGPLMGSAIEDQAQFVRATMEKAGPGLDSAASAVNAPGAAVIPGGTTAGLIASRANTSVPVVLETSTAVSMPRGPGEFFVPAVIALAALLAVLIGVAVAGATGGVVAGAIGVLGTIIVLSCL